MSPSLSVALRLRPGENWWIHAPTLALPGSERVRDCAHLHGRVGEDRAVRQGGLQPLAEHRACAMVHISRGAIHQLSTSHASRHSRTGWLRPRTGISEKGTESLIPAASAASAETTRREPISLFACSIRNARLTTSPMTVIPGGWPPPPVPTAHFRSARRRRCRVLENAARIAGASPPSQATRAPTQPRLKPVAPTATARRTRRGNHLPGTC